MWWKRKKDADTIDIKEQVMRQTGNKETYNVEKSFFSLFRRSRAAERYFSVTSLEERWMCIEEKLTSYLQDYGRPWKAEVTFLPKRRPIWWDVPLETFDTLKKKRDFSFKKIYLGGILNAGELWHFAIKKKKRRRPLRVDNLFLQVVKHYRGVCLPDEIWGALMSKTL